MVDSIIKRGVIKYVAEGSEDYSHINDTEDCLEKD